MAEAATGSDAASGQPDRRDQPGPAGTRVAHVRIPMEPVATTDPGPVDLPRQAAPHEGPGICPGWARGIDLRTALAAGQHGELSGTGPAAAQWEQRLGRAPAEPIDYEAIRSRPIVTSSFSSIRAAAGGYHGYEGVRVKLRTRSPCRCARLSSEAPLAARGLHVLEWTKT